MIRFAFTVIAVIAVMALAGAEASATADTAASRAAALDYLARGTTAFRAGNMAEATSAWSQAISLARTAQDTDIEAQALLRRGEAYRVAGYLRNAAADLQAGLAKAEASGDRSLIASGDGALGSLRLALGNPAEAEMLLKRGRDLARRIGDNNTVAAADLDLANLYLRTHRAGEAASLYTEAATMASAAGDETLAASAGVNAARLALEHRDRAAAAASLSRAVAGLSGLPPTFERGMVLVSVGSVLLDNGTLSPAERLLADRALRAAASMADALRNANLASLARGTLGRLYASAGNPAEATHLTQQALFDAQRASAPELSFRWDWQQARLARQQDHPNMSLVDYRRAVAELEGVRQDIPVEYRDGRSSYRVTFGPLYREFADLLLRRAAADPAHAEPLLREARDTIERLKESELQDYFRDSCVAAFEARRQAIDTVAPGAAVLYPIALPDRLELIVSFGNVLKQFTLPVREAALRREVQQFRELLEKRTTNEYLVPARLLYDQIIRPIDPLLTSARIDTLVIVPDDILRVVPFAALQDGTHFLVERYATAVAPSLHLIDARPLAAGPRLALVLGISQGVQGFVSLPDVSREVTEVHQLEGGEELLNSAFTEARFNQSLKNVPYNIVHVASHGEFNADPKRTFILAYDGKLNMDTLEADIKYSQRRKNPLELLVLSACETATGDDRAALGLAGVALKAGARSAVASLWYVNDKAAGKLIGDFYRALQSGMSKAHALQAAQRQLLADPRLAHPAYWAPYLLIGNWL